MVKKKKRKKGHEDKDKGGGMLERCKTERVGLFSGSLYTHFHPLFPHRARGLSILSTFLSMLCHTILICVSAFCLFSIPAFGTNPRGFVACCSYTQVRAANVESTLAALELARLAQSHLHFISSMGVVVGGSQAAQEEQPLEAPFDRYSGYTASKWLSEQLLRPFAPQTATIYRLGNISGSTLTGLSNPNDTIMQFFQLLMHVRMVCRETCPQVFPLLPADICGNTLVSLLTSTALSRTAIHHVTAARPMTLAQLLTAFACCGVPIQDVSCEAFAERVARLQPGDPMFHKKDSLILSGSNRREQLLSINETADYNDSVEYLCGIIRALNLPGNGEDGGETAILPKD